MTSDKPRALMASLVDARNVAEHKMLKLTIHVPPEQALDFIGLFGWPTMASPIPVAIARLEESAVHRQQKQKQVARGTPFHELPYATQAGIKCADESFQKYLNVETPEGAAVRVRELCKVKSRADIEHDDYARDVWLNLLRDFERPYR